ncbi:hypothetical protein Pflav_056370 [Phytohabitans flavus]|uniref:Uncharacterized protein n=1 Tax=Phytohabitans flavus TaxID=1076124 RepID=A0A6F8XZI9_9ACTN|nr:hypothetical protein [Phytohabitans flavus]BCB79227.1 hypothetical protein Pflav_056370 [Phytohabitans flavus]
MQCWGNPAAMDFRETCAFGMDLDKPTLIGAGGTESSAEAGRRSIFKGDGVVYPVRDPDETPTKTGVREDARMVPFKSVTGESSRDGSAAEPFGKVPDPSLGTRDELDYDVMTRYFSKDSTNEYPYALTAADGTGRATFEVQNDRLSPNLGCGAQYRAPDGVLGPRPCSLVIVPRGFHNPYNGDDVDATEKAVHGSPFTPALWKHRIVVPLDFAPVEGGCSLDKAERRTAGTEAVAEAVTSWQPVLCAGNGPIFGYSAISDFEAATQVTSPLEGAPGLVYSGDPVVSSNPPVVHAPVTLASTVVAINIDYNIINPLDVSGQPPPEEIQRLHGLALTDLKLTPRLLAKLLTQSYPRDGIPGENPDQTAGNPNSIRYDPEFLTLNPVFKDWPRSETATLAGLMVAVGSSTAAREVWQWILSDPEAKAWIQGKKPDENGMWVNPAYKDLFASAPETFPKADPDCYKERRFVPIQGVDVDFLLCALDQWPYMGSMSEAALQTLRAQTKGKGVPLLPLLPPAQDLTECCRFSDLPRKSAGSRFIMSVTDSASAAKYGLFTAQLCKPKRDAAGTLLPPDDCRTATREGMSAAAATAVASQVDGVKVVDPVKAWATPGAYPLTSVTYAIADTSEAADARREYAKLLRYAAGSGQDPGEAWGQLPQGYVPLPASFREQTMIAASQLENWVNPTSPPADNGSGPSETPTPSGVPSEGATPSPVPRHPVPHHRRPLRRNRNRRWVVHWGSSGSC